MPRGVVHFWHNATKNSFQEKKRCRRLRLCQEPLKIVLKVKPSMLEREFGGHITQPEEEKDSLRARVFFGVAVCLCNHFFQGLGRHDCATFL